MTNEEILTKAIAKATSNGWEAGKQIHYTQDMGWVQDSGGEIKVTEHGVSGSLRQILGSNDIIYDHGFAEALWGSGYEPRDPNGDVIAQIGGWRDHLQQMVIADDPIKYLEEHGNIQ